jgi:hypothetical protein
LLAQVRRSLTGIIAGERESLGVFQVALSLLWVPALLLAMYSSYVGNTFTYALSFAVQDGWCDLTDEGVGTHCFGDFGLPFHRGTPGGNGIGYEAGNASATNTPVSMALYAILGLLPYRTALLLFLSVGLVAIAATVAMTSSGLPLATRTYLVVFGAVLSVGTLVSLDRGNQVLFMAPLAATALISRRVPVVMSAAALFISLKVWGLLLVVPLLLQRRFKEAVAAVGLAVLMNLVLLPAFARDYLSGVEAFVSAVLDRDYAAAITQYTITPVGLLRRASCVSEFRSWCPIDGDSESPFPWFSGLLGTVGHGNHPFWARSRARPGGFECVRARRRIPY